MIYSMLLDPFSCVLVRQQELNQLYMRLDSGTETLQPSVPFWWTLTMPLIH